MGLKQYRSKRDFTTTSEPAAVRGEKSKELRFCIQKHAARHLHYDFRLEHRGVLVSWAVPKGPSVNPKDKRLAIKVEDHPLDYQYFEGTIPKGQYGAGTVEIWDAGTYKLADPQKGISVDKQISAGLKKGHLSIIVDGKRLQGEFILQKLKPAEPDDNAWLLIKKKDHYSSSDAPIAKTKKSKMPTFISPMLAKLVEEPFDDPNWLFEIKWDGFRALAFIKQGKVQLKSRSDHALNSQFSAIVKELEKIPGEIIVDGELVILDKKGRSDFQLMQNYQRNQHGTLVYYLFDFLYKDGEDLRERPLIERKTMLERLLHDLSLSQIQYSKHVINGGKKLFKAASKEHLEGIIGKNTSSTYQSKRSADWVKIKIGMRQEVVIGGFTAPRGSRQKFGALLVGVYNDKGDFIYAGHVGGGFNNTLLKDIYTQLQPLIRDACPFKNKPKANASVQWVSPRLICEVSFAEWTQENIMRQPIFQGMRADKPAKTVKKELPESPPATRRAKGEAKKNAFTNLDKIYWPEEKYTKGDLIAYYESIAPYILPYLKGRPIMLHRYPDGIEGKDFYQKDISNLKSPWIKTYPVLHEGDKMTHYLCINSVDSLLYAVNLGSIDLHPFLSHYGKLSNPDFCVIDLDPHGISFKKVVEIALYIHALLETIGVKHYCKTSGGNGLHILIPLHAKYDYEQSKSFAMIVGHLVHQQFPSITSLERAPKKREKKLYIDCLQNRIGQTIVAPYSVRPRPHAKVSTPLEWDELNEKLDPVQFTIQTVPKRLLKKGDLLKNILNENVNLKLALKRLA